MSPKVLVAYRNSELNVQRQLQLEPGRSKLLINLQTVQAPSPSNGLVSIFEFRTTCK